MVNCAKCGKKIGFFQAKHGYTDENGNPIKYCSSCNEECEKKENEKRLSQIKPILEKYFSKCDVMKKFAIGRLYSEKEIVEKFEDESIENVKQYFVNTYSNVEQAIDNGNYDDLDNCMNLKNICEISFDFLNDLEKMIKLFKKKKIETNYPELIELFHNLVEDAINQENEQILKPEHKRISNKLKNNITVKNVLKEFIRTPLNLNVNTEISKLLLERFNLEFEEDELPELIEELKEEVDLENFEDNLGENTKQFSLPDYSSLNGYQFESFLKKLFEALGYVVVQTKLSVDQGADLIVMKNGEKTAVQAKKYSGKVSNKAIQEVVAAKKHYNCNNSMVVTTGEFTKSAIQLAISNKVEIWDNNKLKKILSEVNNSSKPSLGTSQITTLTEDTFPVSCPYCDSAISISLEEIPGINEETKMECSECGMGLLIRIPEKFYSCTECKKELKTLKDRIEHLKTCKKLKEKQFKCKYCKKEFTLDDSESKELKKKGTIKVECPVCNKSNVFKK